jgi:hypothetical protein
MRTTRNAQRGFTLVIALMVVLMATMMVVGAIQFTGSERQAAVLRDRDERLSGCITMARNVFLSRVSFLSGKGAMMVGSLDAGIGPPGPEQLRIRTDHYRGSPVSVGFQNVEVLKNRVDMGANIQDITNKAGEPADVMAQDYRITAICAERVDDAGVATAEQEVEFVIRLGLQ